MLTGEYDWSNTTEMSQQTADKIKGAKHKTMPKLGHFPATVSTDASRPRSELSKCEHG
jgi:hypothetical protein